VGETRSNTRSRERRLTAEEKAARDFVRDAGAGLRPLLAVPDLCDGDSTEMALLRARIQADPRAARLLRPRPRAPQCTS